MDVIKLPDYNINEWAYYSWCQIKGYSKEEKLRWDTRLTVDRILLVLLRAEYNDNQDSKERNDDI